MNREIDLLALRLAGRRLSNERSYAQEQRKYGNPADCVEFEKGESMHENLGTKQIESILRHDLENWLRWGRRRDWAPTSFRCPLGFLYKSSDVHEGVPVRQPACDEIGAAGFERIVVSLPEKHRKAFVMYHLSKAHLHGRIVVIKGREDGARLLGVQVRQYHYMVNQAHSMVLRQWRVLLQK